MEQLIKQTTMSSREIAELTGKEHKNVLSDCDKLNESYNKLGLAEISAGVYYHPNTGNQQHREMLLTRMQCFDLLTGYRTDLRIKVNRRWEELEIKQRQQQQIDFSDPDTVLMLAQNWKEERQKRIEAEQKIEADKPKVLFVESFETSKTTISVGDMSKLIRQQGISIGQNRFYDWLTEHKYLMCRKRWSVKKQCYKNDYMPTQKAADLGVFYVIERTVTYNIDEPPIIKHTIKITPKGQTYFINKFLTEKVA
jgi:phage antirepressor YoqD-like protein